MNNEHQYLLFLKIKSELQGLHNEVDIDPNCLDSLTRDLSLEATSHSTDQPQLLHPRPRLDRREICLKPPPGNS